MPFGRGCNYPNGLESVLFYNNGGKVNKEEFTISNIKVKEISWKRNIHSEMRLKIGDSIRDYL
jgi:hypothetical protein